MTAKTLLIVVIVALGFLFARKQLDRFVEKTGRAKEVLGTRIQSVRVALNLGLIVVSLLVVIVVAGVSWQDLAVVFSSMFAVVGVALFAQWSILSNVTASIIVFFFFPYRVGDYVTVIDGENTISGTILEISLFHVILQSDNADTRLTYPNALVFQKAVSIKAKQSQGVEAAHTE